MVTYKDISCHLGTDGPTPILPERQILVDGCSNTTTCYVEVTAGINFDIALEIADVIDCDHVLVQITIDGSPHVQRLIDLRKCHKHPDILVFRGTEAYDDGTWWFCPWKLLRINANSHVMTGGRHSTVSTYAVGSIVVSVFRVCDVQKLPTDGVNHELSTWNDLDKHWQAAPRILQDDYQDKKLTCFVGRRGKSMELAQSDQVDAWWAVQYATRREWTVINEKATTQAVSEEPLPFAEFVFNYREKNKIPSTPCPRPSILAAPFSKPQSSRKRPHPADEDEDDHADLGNIKKMTDQSINHLIHRLGMERARRASKRRRTTSRNVDELRKELAYKKALFQGENEMHLHEIENFTQAMETIERHLKERTEWYNERLEEQREELEGLERQIALCETGEDGKNLIAADERFRRASTASQALQMVVENGPLPQDTGHGVMGRNLPWKTPALKFLERRPQMDERHNSKARSARSESTQEL